MRLLETENNIYCKDVDVLGKLFCSLIGDANYECVLAAYLDNDMRLKGVVELAYGTYTQVVHNVYDIYYCAFKLSSRKIVMAHNHPDGRLSPSTSDIHATQTINKILLLNNVELIDHLIICGDKFTSVLTET